MRKDVLFYAHLQLGWLRLLKWISQTLAEDCQVSGLTIPGPKKQAAQAPENLQLNFPKAAGGQLLIWSYSSLPGTESLSITLSCPSLLLPASCQFQFTLSKSLRLNAPYSFIQPHNNLCVQQQTKKTLSAFKWQFYRAYVPRTGIILWEFNW